uniref:Uncharacterized protein n=1 Tax=Daphnia galeata TaxID=27404 RepID=A0A8J2WE29_9CRUS|nr:unnamed protein product [Daphnia galeata]
MKRNDKNRFQLAPRLGPGRRHLISYSSTAFTGEPISNLKEAFFKKTQPAPYSAEEEEEEAPAPAVVPYSPPALVYAVPEPEQPVVVEQPVVPASPISTIDAVVWNQPEEDQQVLQEFVPVRQEEEVYIEQPQAPTYVQEEEAPSQEGSLLLSVGQELSQEPEYQEPVRQIEPELVQQPVYQEPVEIQEQTFQVEEQEVPTVQQPVEIQQEQEQYVEPVQIPQEPEQTYQISQEYLPPFPTYKEVEVEQEETPVLPEYEPAKIAQPELEIVQEYVEPIQQVVVQEPEIIATPVVIPEVEQEYVEPVQIVQEPEVVQQELVEPVQIPELPTPIQEEPEQSYQVEQEIEKQPSPKYKEPSDQQFNFQQTIEDFAKKQTDENLTPVISANKQAGRGRPIRPRPIIFQRTEEDLFQKGFPEVAAPEGDDVPLDEQAAIREAIFELKKESRSG